jgi:hypothetical protein
MAAACSSGTSGTTPSSPGSPAPSSASVWNGSPARASVWIAVFGVASDPNDLDDDTARLAPLLGTAIRISPAQCFHGLPASAGQGYLIGAIAQTKTELRELVSAARVTPLFEWHVDELCLD